MYTYLASPYTSPEELIRVRRFRQARRIAGLFALADIPVYSPIVHGHSLLPEISGLISETESHEFWLRLSETESHEFWLRQCRPLVRAASRVVVITLEGWEDSLGIAHEVVLAEDLNIPVYYLDFNDIPGRFSEAITYLRNRYPIESAAKGIRPSEAPLSDGVHPGSRPAAPSGSP